MTSEEIDREGRLYLYGPRPVTSGTVRHCVSFWHDNLSLTGQALARLRVQHHGSAYWLHAEELAEIQANAEI